MFIDLPRQTTFLLQIVGTADMIGGAVQVASAAARCRFSDIEELEFVRSQLDALK